MSDVGAVEDSFAQGFQGNTAVAPDVTAASPSAATPAASPPAGSDRGIVELDAAKAAVAEKYPALAPHLADAKVQWGAPNGSAVRGGQLEFYPPWESNNPNPGKVTLEIYNRDLQGKSLQDAIAGDMLHHLGGVDPETHQPVDAKWLAMRNEVIAGRDADAKAMDERAYTRAVAEGDHRTFGEWMDTSRADAHLRGYITPDKDNNWKDAYTPEQKSTMDKMKAYLATPPESAESAFLSARSRGGTAP